MFAGTCSNLHQDYCAISVFSLFNGTYVHKYLNLVGSYLHLLIPTWEDPANQGSSMKIHLKVSAPFSASTKAGLSCSLRHLRNQYTTLLFGFLVRFSFPFPSFSSLVAVVSFSFVILSLSEELHKWLWWHFLKSAAAGGSRKAAAWIYFRMGHSDWSMIELCKIINICSKHVESHVLAS